MQKKVTAEGEKEVELFEKFMCYSKHGDEALAKSISDAEAKVGQVTADIEAGEEEIKQLKADLKSHQADRAAAKTAMAEATKIREKEAAAVEKGMGGSFLQTASAQVLRNLVMGKNDIA